jgi:hypothetical protein
MQIVGFSTILLSNRHFGHIEKHKEYLVFRLNIRNFAGKIEK